MFDDGYLYNSLKMKNMKNIVCKAYSQWDENIYHNFMERFSLNENQLISALSKGMKMKFALTLALSHHAEFLIMDEPTSGLDPLVRRDLLHILADFMDLGGKGVFYSSHITSDLDKFADILVFIHHGKIVFVEDKDELLDSHFLVKGNNNYLTEENKKYFIDLEVKHYRFLGITNQLTELQKTIPDLIAEHVNIEDIMLGYIEGGKLNV